jgi:hypothetical protein
VFTVFLDSIWKVRNLKKAKKRRNNEDEEDSSSELERRRILASHLRQSLSSRRHRMLQVPRTASRGGPSSGAYFRHHNFRYGPEPPAYKTPKPEYPSNPKREIERATGHDRYSVTAKSTDEEMLQRFIRRFWKDWAENELDQEEPPEVKTGNKVDELSDITSRDLAKAERILQQQLTEAELQPLTDYFGKKRQELAEAEFDPERLLRQLEANPTVELHQKTLTELSREPKFIEEEVEGGTVEKDRLASVGALDQIERYGDRGLVNAEPSQPEPRLDEPLDTTQVYSEVVPRTVAEIGSISEAELLSDVQDLMHELEPEVEKEREEVEPSY